MLSPCADPGVARASRDGGREPLRRRRQDQRHGIGALSGRQLRPIAALEAGVADPVPQIHLPDSQIPGHGRDCPVPIEDQRHRVSLELLPEPPPSPTRRRALRHRRHDYLQIEVSSQQGHSVCSHAGASVRPGSPVRAVARGCSCRGISGPSRRRVQLDPLAGSRRFVSAWCLARIRWRRLGCRGGRF